MSGNWLPPTDAPPEAEAVRAPEADARAAVALHQAHYLSRAGAAVIDFFVRLAIVLAVVLVVALAAPGDRDALEIAVFVGALLALPYAPIMIARTGGQTVGHQATHTRIVRRDGTPLDGNGAVVREVLVKSLLFENLGALLLFVPTLLNYLWPLWDAQDEALHDKLCKTRVVDA